MSADRHPVLLTEPKGPEGAPNVSEGAPVMLDILDPKNKLIASFRTDRPQWALDQFFRNRPSAGCHYAAREIRPLHRG